MKKYLFLAAALVGCMQVSAQDVKLRGVYEGMRNNDGDDRPTEWVGSIYDENGQYTGKTLFFVPEGLYAMTWNGTGLTTPEKDPAVTKSEVIDESGHVNLDKAQWAIDFNLMSGKSGAVYADGKVVTIHSRDESSTTDEELFAVRKWDATTGKLLSSEYRPKSDCLESAGMSYNPIDGKVYGLFYMTGVQLPENILNDPEYFADQDDDMTDGDAGYAIGTIDLKTMKVTQITPGIYYQNFVTFAINSEGRAFALTSGGSNGYEKDGMIYTLGDNSEDVRAGAHLYEFDLTTGLMKTVPTQVVDPETNETYTEYVNIFNEGTGYCSQYRRQAACFSKSNPYKMYWVGFYNSGKGVNDWGSWTSLSDKEWKTNHKYDTCLYEVDIMSGKGKRLATITDRYRFSALWVDGDDCSDGAGIEVSGISDIRHNTDNNSNSSYFNLSGQRVETPAKGIYIANGRKVVVK